ncbi:hypothetical protein ACFFJY_15265 [Fictibacillus aquaticus]|nr:hypothetical protein [Fictibacillus aquaticus]
MARLLLVFLLVLLIGGCSDSDKLIRIDIIEETLDKPIMNSEKITDIETLFDKVTWETSKVQMARKEDVRLTFFYQFDKNEPERLEEYLIWFNDRGKAEMMDRNKPGSYGTLGKADAEKLKKLLNEKGDNLK